MDMAKLIPFESSLAIQIAIEKGSFYGGEIWQTNQMLRSHLEISQVHCDDKLGKIVIKTFNLLEINEVQPLFVRLCYRNILFKLDPKDYRVQGDKIICQYPKEGLGLAERKGGERYLLPFDSDISLSLRRTERIFRETIMDLEVRIVDISEKGAGIILSNGNRKLLRAMDRFWIKSINHIPLEFHIFGRVCYVAPKGYYLKRGDVRLGLCFESPIEHTILELLKKRSELVLTA